MRGKRSKQYRKLMKQFERSFGFREPYQVLLDADIIRDADRFKMDLVGGLERTLHGQVKPMITQCSIRHLYKAAAEPGVPFLIDKAKTYERRRCDHRPEDYPEPLSTKDCLSSVVDPKDNKTNKHCYVVASQELEVRKHMRGILGVPLIYINRSVMIMEPMAGATAENREKEERIKFRAGLKRGSGSLKRKRGGDEDGESEGEPKSASTQDTPKKKKKFVKGPKGPNPLAVKKSKKKPEGEGATTVPQESKKDVTPKALSLTGQDGAEGSSKRKRKRMPRAAADGRGITAVPEVAHDDELKIVQAF